MQIERGTQINRQECPGCGADIPVKVNSAGNVYFYCARVVGTQPNGKPEKCLSRLNIGRMGSKQLIENYLKKKENDHVQEPIRQERGGTEPEHGIGHNGGPALDEPEPAAPEPKPERTGLTSWI